MIYEIANQKDNVDSSASFLIELLVNLGIFLGDIVVGIHTDVTSGFDLFDVEFFYGRMFRFIRAYCVNNSQKLDLCALIIMGDILTGKGKPFLSCLVAAVVESLLGDAILPGNRGD